jgi:hypothetical protein
VRLFFAAAHFKHANFFAAKGFFNRRRDLNAGGLTADDNAAGGIFRHNNVGEHNGLAVLGGEAVDDNDIAAFNAMLPAAGADGNIKKV